jgi:hypothetical protein
MERRYFITGGTAALASLGLASCNHFMSGPPPHARGGRPPHAPAHGRRAKGGPPPHAPAHGYRHKHRQRGVDLVFDSGLGVYVVVGYPFYFHKDRFYRHHDGVWQISVRIDGGWRGVADHEVPQTLYWGKKGKKRKKAKKGKKGKWG